MCTTYGDESGSGIDVCKLVSYFNEDIPDYFGVVLERGMYLRRYVIYFFNGSMQDWRIFRNSKRQKICYGGWS